MYLKCSAQLVAQYCIVSPRSFSMLDARKLQHQSHLTWQSRCAPRCVGDELPPSSWRERALKHRELCPVLQGRPPKLVEGNDGGKSIVNDVNDVKDMKVSEESALFSPDKDFDWQSSLHWSTPSQRLDDDDDGDDDADGNITGVLCRVELSRYIARRSAILALEAERSRQLHSEAFSANTESDDWTTEVPGAQAAEILSLKDTVAWKAVLEAISFERTQLRRGFSNKWPDSLWSPGCLADLDSESARSELCRIELQLAEWIKDLEALADGSDVIRQGLQAMPVVVLLRQLLCDFRIATGDLPGAATALAGAVATESGADPLRPPLLIGWEDSLSCNYLKAQQCFRLGWLALLAVGESRAAAQARAVKPVWYGVKVVRVDFRTIVHCTGSHWYWSWCSKSWLFWGINQRTTTKGSLGCLSSIYFRTKSSLGEGLVLSLKYGPKGKEFLVGRASSTPSTPPRPRKWIRTQNNMTSEQTYWRWLEPFRKITLCVPIVFGESLGMSDSRSTITWLPVI